MRVTKERLTRLRHTGMGLAAALALSLQPGAAAAGEGLVGQLLVAAPDMVDPNFARTVVYLVRHDDTGALGLVVNEPMGEVPLERLMGVLVEEQSEAPVGRNEGGTAVDDRLWVYYGGPVEPRRAFTLHSRDVMLESSVPVDKGIAVNAKDDVLKALAAGQAPRHTLFALGYAGWAAGQLEAEIDGGAWVVVAADEELVFGEDPQRIWELAIARHTPEL